MIVNNQSSVNLLLFMTRGMSLAAWKRNGSLTRELALYERLAERGLRTSVISWGGKEDIAIAAAFPWLSVYFNTRGLARERYERLLPLIHALPLLRADIIKSNQINGADLALRCARFWKKPFIARCGYLWSNICAQQHPELLAGVQALEKEVFTHASLCVVTTEAIRDAVLRACKLPVEQVTCVPNYVPDYFYRVPPGDGAKPSIVTAVGRLSPEKNLFALIDACAGLDLTLRLMGEGEQRAELAARAVARGVRLEMPGNMPHQDLPRLLAESAVCVLVSLFEGHPKALIEYMACGRAVLGTKVEGIAPLIRDGENGLLCATDAASIRQGLQRLLADASLRRRLGQQAREDARRFSLERIAEQELDLYGKLPRSSFSASLGQGIRHCLGAAFRAARHRRIRRPTKPPPPGTSSSAEVSVRSREAFVEKTLAGIQDWLADKSPADALRLLFTLDQRLYALQGARAVAYDNGVHTKHRHTRYHDFFVKRLHPGERVLDIGCGNGFLAWDMAEKGGALVTGIDLAPENIRIARERFSHPRVTHIRGDALRDLPEGEYETVVLSNVLEHLPECAAFLRKALAALRPARCLIRVPLFERDWRVPLKKELGLEWRLDATHETEYTLESFAEEMDAAGLAVIHQEIRWSEIWCEACPR
ncbi:MAG: glycosyltransferase [Deltaproteobacteria bacterium]|jgi:glycosyltransferase involved in cell wall biosynthesis/2-polyprenyl-3-methyl-5-hydroxy-6-metoxy-1,4-benzoquinol methylase|nr:glycosyltransferase [Deltaproteobacteria bacterium]